MESNSALASSPFVEYAWPWNMEFLSNFIGFQLSGFVLQNFLANFLCLLNIKIYFKMGNFSVTCYSLLLLVLNLIFFSLFLVLFICSRHKSIHAHFACDVELGSIFDMCVWEVSLAVLRMGFSLSTLCSHQDSKRLKFPPRGPSMRGLSLPRKSLLRFHSTS